MPAHSLARLFRMTLAASAVRLSHVQFTINAVDWQTIDKLFMNCFDSSTKQEGISNEFASLHISDLCKEGDTEKEALNKAIDHKATLNALALQSDRNNMGQRRILRSAIHGKNWGLHAEKGGVGNETYKHFADSIYAAMKTIERLTEKEGGTNDGQGTLYVSQRKYGRHPSMPYIKIQKYNEVSFPKETKKRNPEIRPGWQLWFQMWDVWLFNS